MTDRLFKTWNQLGVAFGGRISSRNPIDLEKTILETVEAGRENSRLLFGMYGWLLKHHDLVNGHRLIRLLKRSRETSVMGAVCDFLLEKDSRSTFSYARNHCRPERSPTFVFRSVGDSSALASLNRKENLPVWKKWNRISREIDPMEGAIMNKPYVLKNNKNLALRALLGPGLRAEILSYFLVHDEGNPHEIAEAIDQSYEPVYAELKSFRGLGIAADLVRGRARVFRLEGNFLHRVATVLPV